MKEKIDLKAYTGKIAEALPKGILLNTNGGKFNTMVIGWGHIGFIWGRDTFVAFVRESRYTKAQIDKTGEFTVSIPEGKPDGGIIKICGMQSGRNMDKVKEAGLTLEEPSVIKTPGIKEFPITLECRVLYSGKIEISALPEDIQEKMYPQNVGSDNPLANRDAHTMYVGEIVDAYIIK